MNNKIYIMNSAMMPQEGSYSRWDISSDEFKKIFLAADEIVSSVAYPSIQKVVGSFLDITIPIDRSKSLTEILEDEATILVVKLKYRVPHGQKGRVSAGHGQSFDDYEFILVKYER